MSAAEVARVTTFVAVSPDDAFEAFTDDIDVWWRRGPRFRNGGGRSELSFERDAEGRGQRLVERLAHRVLEIGRVLAWQPGQRLVFEWRQINFAPDEVTEVEVRFEPMGDGTRVTLEHRGWDAIGDDHPARHGLRERAFGAMVGKYWGDLLSVYRQYVARRAPGPCGQARDRSWSAGHAPFLCVSEGYESRANWLFSRRGGAIEQPGTVVCSEHGPTSTQRSHNVHAVVVELEGLPAIAFEMPNGFGCGYPHVVGASASNGRQAPTVQIMHGCKVAVSRVRHQARRFGDHVDQIHIGGVEADDGLSDVVSRPPSTSVHGHAPGVGREPELVSGCGQHGLRSFAEVGTFVRPICPRCGPARPRLPWPDPCQRPQYPRSRARPTSRAPCRRCVSSHALQAPRPEARLRPSETTWRL